MEPLTAFDPNSVQISWEQNNTYQIVLTAYASQNNMLAFEMLDVENSVFFDGEEYVIKQLSFGAQDGFITKQITATHVYNETSRVMQTKVNYGVKTYTVNDVLKHYFNGNKLGFSWKVYGNFDKQKIENLGGDSAKDGLSKIIDTWSNVVIFPENKLIRVYEFQAFRKELGNRIDYLHDTSSVQLDSDSTAIVNQVQAIGKKKDSNSNKTSYYFEPFIVSNQNSIDKWGLHRGSDISDERFTDKKAMEKYVMSQMASDPSLSISITSETNSKPIPGEIMRLEIRPISFVTNVEVVGYTWYPLSKTQSNTLTLNNTSKTILDYQKRNENSLSKIMKNQKNNINGNSTVIDIANKAYESSIYGEVIGESEY